MGGFGIGEALGAVTAGAGMAIEATANRRAYKWGTQMAYDDQLRAKEMSRFNYDQQMRMWRETGPQGQMEQLKAAGLNPGLIYGMGGAGGQTAAAAPGQSATGKMQKDNMGAAIGGMGMQLAQLSLLNAQKENIEADTANKLGDAANKPIVGKNIEADTANKIADQVFKEYTGKEAKAMYEEVNQPNRDIQARAKTDELSAISAFGQNINEMFIEGKLRDKTNAEVEQAMLNNAKTREETRNIIKTWDKIDQEIKGQKLSNIILDLEQKLQTKTGIDKTSAGWLKILGRLFINLTGE